MGCSTFSSPWVQVKVNKTSYLETVWAPLGSSEQSVPFPQQHFRKASEEPLGACSATCLTESHEEIPGAIQEWDFWNSACAILHTGNSWLFSAWWVSGIPGTRAQPSPSLPWLAGESRVCKVPWRFLKLLEFYYYCCCDFISDAIDVPSTDGPQTLVDLMVKAKMLHAARTVQSREAMRCLRTKVQHFQHHLLYNCPGHCPVTRAARAQKPDEASIILLCFTVTLYYF